MKIKVKMFLLVMLFICSFFSSNAYSNSDLDSYNLRYTVDKAKQTLNIQWDEVGGSKSYLLKVFDDNDMKLSFYVYSTRYTINIKDFAGKTISFMVAAPGDSFSNKVSYEVFSKNKPVAYNPVGTINGSTINFSWGKVENAKIYHFQLYTAAEEPVKQFYVNSSKSSCQVEDLPAGLYKWRVKPENSNNEQGQFSEWTYFNISETPLNSENIFGFEKDAITTALQTALTYPEAAIYGPDGAIYVSDTYSHVIRKVTSNRSEIYAGTLIAGFNGDGGKTKTQLNMPGGLIFDLEGNLIFQDIGNHKIRKVDKYGQISTLISYTGSSKNIYMDGNGGFIFPVVKDRVGKIIHYKSDNSVEYLLPNYKFENPTDIILNGNKIIVADKDLQKIFLFENEKLINSIDLSHNSSPELYYDGKHIYCGIHTSIYKLDWTLNKSDFSTGYANVTFIRENQGGDKLIVTDSDNGTIYLVNKDTGINEVMVSASDNPSGVIKIAKFDNYLYLLDNSAATVWRLKPDTGCVERFIGNGKKELATIGNGRLDTGLFYPTGMTIDSNGNVFISEQHHILRINAFTNKVELFAGAPGRDKYGFSGDGGLATKALFQSVRGLSFDKQKGDLYVADSYNNRVRKIDSDGIVTTIYGDGVQGAPTFGQHGTKSHATNPRGVTVSEDNVFICDSWNNTVIKIDTQGIVQPVAGLAKYAGYQGNGGYSGDEGDALISKLNTPTNTFYQDGILYIADTFNNRIRVVTHGKIYTLIGSNQNGFSAINDMILNFPADIYVDDQYVYIADTGNGLIRKYKKAAIDINLNTSLFGTKQN